LTKFPRKAKRVPYKLVKGPHDARGWRFTDASTVLLKSRAMILQKLKSAAEDFLGEKVDKAVITVPAYFNDAQRQATKQAGEVRAWKSCASSTSRRPPRLPMAWIRRRTKTIAVYDLGGRHFDISILEVGEGWWK